MDVEREVASVDPLVSAVCDDGLERGVQAGLQGVVLVSHRNADPFVRPVSLADELEAGALGFEAGCAYQRYLEDWTLEASIVPGNILSVSSYLAILSCVAAGTGYAVVPQCVLDTVWLSGAVRCYPLPGKLSRIETQLVWREDYRSVNFDALLDFLPDAGSRRAENDCSGMTQGGAKT